MLFRSHAEFYSDHYFTVLPGLRRQSSGYVTLENTPGLGLEIDEEEIARHPPLERTSSAGGRTRGI